MMDSSLLEIKHSLPIFKKKTMFGNTKNDTAVKMNRYKTAFYLERYER